MLVYSSIILIDNALKYSDEGGIEISIYKNDDALFLKVVSPLNSIPKTKSLNEHWERLLKYRSQEKLGKFLDEDTGSGLARIFTFIRHSENSNFSYEVENGLVSFVLEIKMLYVDDLIQYLEGSS